MAELLIGVDLGGTQIRALLVDGQGKALNRASTLTRPDDGLEAIIRRIQDTVRRALGNIPWGQIRGIGVGAPGPVDPWTGVVVGAPNLPGWQDVPLRDIMAELAGFHAPALFIHGSRDDEAIGAPEYYARFCKRPGIPAVFHTVAGANHSYYSVEWEREVIDTTLDWLRER